MAGRIIFTSPLATQSDIHKFYRLNSLNYRVTLHDCLTLFCAKIAGYLRSIQDKVTPGL